MNIYLDVDGVLVTKNGTPAVDVIPFLKEATEKHDVFWLTTHCKGNAKPAVNHLKELLPKEALQYLEKIKPTDWQTLKTEAIDFSKDFRWFDDYPLRAERDVLAKHDAEGKLVLCDAKKGVAFDGEL